jgi:hypothetical protein
MRKILPFKKLVLSQAQANDICMLVTPKVEQVPLFSYSDVITQKYQCC